jgi:hypothetical protein
MRPTVARFVSLLFVLSVVTLVPNAARAQEPKSAALVKELTQLLDSAKLDAMAAKDPSAPDLFVAALYFQGSQLLVVSAKYSVPSLLVDKIGKKEYRDVYTDLNSAGVEGTKCLVMDMGADGLKVKRDDNRFDTADIGAKSYVFDGEWKKQKLGSEDEYVKAHHDADEKYAKMLTALIAQAKKQ